MSIGCIWATLEYVLRTPYMIYGGLRGCTASSGSDQYTVCIPLTVYQRTVLLHSALRTSDWIIHSVLCASIKPSCPLYPTVSTSAADPCPTRCCPPTSPVRYGNARNLQRLDFPFRLFLAVFFPFFFFCRSSPPLRFFFLFSTFSSLAPSLFPSFFLQSCCSSSSCTTFFFIADYLVVLVCS